MRMIIISFCLVGIVTSTGSALAAPKPFVEDFQVATDLNFQLVDERPAAEKESSKGSSNRQACDFAVWRVGDDEVLPSRIDYLATRLQREGKSDALKGAVVRVKEYSIYFNHQLSSRAALNRVSLIPGQGVVLQEALGALVRSFECWAGPAVPGGYDFSEHPGARAAGIVTIRLEIAGKPIEARGFFAPGKDDQHLPIGGTALIRAVDALIQRLNGGV